MDGNSAYRAARSRNLKYTVSTVSVPHAAKLVPIPNTSELSCCKYPCATPIACNTLNPPKVINDTPCDDRFLTTAISCGKKSRALHAHPNPNKNAIASFIVFLVPSLIRINLRYADCMKKLLMITSLIVTVSSVTLAAQNCSETRIRTTAADLLATQAKLAKLPADNANYDDFMSKDKYQLMPIFKKQIIDVADAFMACEPVNPEALSTAGDKLAKLLNANQPNNENLTNEQIENTQWVGQNLTVKSSVLQTKPAVIALQIGYDIICGDDNALLLYRVEQGHWERVILWQSHDYELINGAFGDIFLYQFLPDHNHQDWLVAVVHGHPWCTSNMSVFDVDLIKPESASSPQQTVFHTEYGYWRDEETKMNSTPDGFEVHFVGHSIDMAYIRRPEILHLKRVGNTLERLQPIALDQESFVDHWLQIDWNIASRWATKAHIDELHRIHELVFHRYDKSQENISYDFGPVLGCSDDPRHFQVLLDRSKFIGKDPYPRLLSHMYFQLRSDAGIYTMFSVSHNPDAHCSGPDLTPKDE